LTPRRSRHAAHLVRHTLAVFAVLSTISISALWLCASLGYTLYYGDAEAHLNIARRVLDSRTPGLEQLGTVWLPLPHLLMLPFVARDDWWMSGLGGAMPVSACFVAAGVFLFASARRRFSSYASAWTAALMFALNLNMLYLQSTPMTEPVFAAALAGLLWATLWYRDSQSLVALLAAAAAAIAASLTRYEGWIIAPAAALFMLVSARDKRHAILFAALAALGPLAWLAHNQFYYSNALEFYNGDYSALAIYRRQLAQGMARYPGDHDWPKALEYYFAAIKLTLGWPSLVIGVAGAAACALKRAWWPLFLLLLPPAFYLWSIYASGIPIYVPDLWPNAWYNVRYGLAALPLTAFCAAGLVAALPTRIRVGAVLGVTLLIGVAVLLTGPAASFRESEMNSAARRTWTREVAATLQASYQSGGGVIYSFGDLTGVLREARIPLREGRHEGNRPSWDAAVQRPDLFLRDEWALAISGDKVSTAISRSGRTGPHYRLRGRIIVKGAPVVELYQRTPQPSR